MPDSQQGQRQCVVPGRSAVALSGYGTGIPTLVLQGATATRQTTPWLHNTRESCGGVLSEMLVRWCAGRSTTTKHTYQNTVKSRTCSAAVNMARMSLCVPQWCACYTTGVMDHSDGPLLHPILRTYQ